MLKHGHNRREDGPSPTYRSWINMMTRCYNHKAEKYQRYGGRGITVCERWHDFKNFLEDMGVRPEGKTLDRKDVNGNYEPGNCKWATDEEQAQNTERAAMLTVGGVTKHLKEWAEDTGIPYFTLFKRVQAGWDPERTISKKTCTVTYLGETKTLQQWADHLGLHVETLRKRVARGLTPERVLKKGTSK